MNAADLSATLRRNTERALAKHEGVLAARLEQALRQEAGRAARRFRAKVTQHALVAAAPSAEAAMVALYPAPDEALALAQPNGEPVDVIHMTLAFLGEIAPDQAEAVAAVIREVAGAFEPLAGTVGGIASFGSETGVLAALARVAARVAPDGGYGTTAFQASVGAVLWIPADWTTADEAETARQAFLAVPGVLVVYVGDAEQALPTDQDWTVVWANGQALVEASYPSIVLPDVPGLAELRQAVCEALDAAGLPYSRLHGFTPHITLAYQPEPTSPPADLLGQGLSFDRLSVTRGDVPRDFPLGSMLVAAGEPPDWTAPHPDEIFDAAAFVATLHTKADPVRRALINDLGAGLPIDWDTTNPLAGKVLARSAGKVTYVADTTRLNLMRTIRAAYEEGLSIPETAKAIQQGMRDAAPARARLIARTELVAVANGGQLALAQAVGQETGIGYYKRWLTAPGAEDPRHEDYEGLDGQTVVLDGSFDVGGYQLDYPGDPAGPPEEVCICRCTMEMVESPGVGE